MFLNLKSATVYQSNKITLIRPEDIIAEAFVRVEPAQIYEGDELKIFVKVKNIMVKFNFIKKLN